MLSLNRLLLIIPNIMEPELPEEEQNGTIAFTRWYNDPLLQAIPLENDTRVAPFIEGCFPYLIL